MNKFWLTAVTLTSFCAAANVAASTTTSPQAHRGGFYLGAGVGVGNLYEYSYDEDQTTYFYTPAHIAARFEAGYLFSRTAKLLLGLETGFNYLPQEPDTWVLGPFSGNDNTNVYALDLLGVTKYYVSQRFNLFGKFGVAYVRYSTNGTTYLDGTEIDSYNTSRNSFMPELGVGIGCDISHGLEVTAAFNSTIGWEGNYPAYNLFVVGLDYHF